MAVERYRKSQKTSQNSDEINTKFEEISAEENRLREQFSEIDESKKNVVEATIKDVAFLTVQMKYLRENIVRDGTTSEYQNGENQWGTKQSPDAQLYMQMSQKLTTATKVLLECMPKTERIVHEDGFDEFTDERD